MKEAANGRGWKQSSVVEQSLHMVSSKVGIGQRLLGLCDEKERQSSRGVCQWSTTRSRDSHEEKQSAEEAVGAKRQSWEETHKDYVVPP